MRFWDEWFGDLWGLACRQLLPPQRNGPLKGYLLLDFYLETVGQSRATFAAVRGPTGGITAGAARDAEQPLDGLHYMYKEWTSYRTTRRYRGVRRAATVETSIRAYD